MSNELIEAARDVATPAQFDRFRSMLADAGGMYERPVGDLSGNVTAISAAGDPQHLLFELVTNSIDALLEREAVRRQLAGQDIPQDPRLLGQQMRADDPDIGDRLAMTLRDSGDSSRPTFTMRDVGGVGIAESDVRKTIMSLGQSPKNTKLYLAGAFGKGGGTLHRESMGAVVVGRPSPELCETVGCEDRVWVTTVRATSEPGGKVRCWMYAVADEFDPDRPGDTGAVLSFPGDGIDFEPGVMVTHVGYNAPQLAKATRFAVDARSLNIVGNTRLYDPVLPWHYQDHRTDDGERRRMTGRSQSFRNGTPTQLRNSPLHQTIPILDPTTGDRFDLAVTAFLFEQAARRGATANGHTVCFVSAGQVQAHWDVAETRRRANAATNTNTALRRVAEKALFVEVNLDGIPHLRRTEMVAPDRTHLTDTGLARTVQDSVIDWLVRQDVILDLERELAMQTSREASNEIVASHILDEIGKKLGFSGVPSSGSSPDKPRPPKPPEVLLTEPTELSGPLEVTVIAGITKQIRFHLNAQDSFIDMRSASIQFNVDTPDSTSTIAATLGPLSKGRFSAAIAMDASIPEGTYDAVCSIEWFSATSTMKSLDWKLAVRFVHTAPDKNTDKNSGPASRPLVVAREGSDPDSPGEFFDFMTGNDWAAVLPPPLDQEARAAGDNYIVAIDINTEFTGWRRYIKQLALNKRDHEVTKYRNRYYVGVAYALARIEGGTGKHLDATDHHFDTENSKKAAAAIAAESVIASLPQPKDDAK